MEKEDKVKNLVSVWSNVLNKQGFLAYGLLVLGSFFPAFTISYFGQGSSFSGTDLYGVLVVFLMIVGAASCALGLPKIISKGVGLLLLVYFYYYLFKALGEVSQLKSLVGGFGRSADFGQILEFVLSSVGIGFVMLLLGFILLHIFIFKEYKLHSRFEALDVLLEHYSSKAKEYAKDKSEQAKIIAAEKSSEMQKKANQIKESQLNDKEK